jgi:hypothetical protein
MYSSRTIQLLNQLMGGYHLSESELEALEKLSNEINLALQYRKLNKKNETKS